MRRRRLACVLEPRRLGAKRRPAQTFCINRGEREEAPAPRTRRDPEDGTQTSHRLQIKRPVFESSFNFIFIRYILTLFDGPREPWDCVRGVRPVCGGDAAGRAGICERRRRRRRRDPSSALTDPETSGGRSVYRSPTCTHARANTKHGHAVATSARTRAEDAGRARRTVKKRHPEEGVSQRSHVRAFITNLCRTCTYGRA